MPRKTVHCRRDVESHTVVTCSEGMVVAQFETEIGADLMFSVVEITEGRCESDVKFAFKSLNGDLCRNAVDGENDCGDDAENSFHIELY